MVHGGEIYRQSVKLDFSVNTNPLADVLPQELEDAAIRSLKKLHCYPDRTAERLRRAIALYEAVPEEMILCGNGASELFMAIVRAIQPRRAAVVDPCFSGYEWALRAAGCFDIAHYPLQESSGFAVDDGILDFLTEEMDVLFLANPNNPTGRLMDGGLWRAVVERCEELGIVVVWDACFWALSETGRPNVGSWEHVICVNAMTKTLSIPGVRLGYLTAGSESMRRAIRRQLPEWNVSLIAQEMGAAGAKLLAETDFLERSRALIAREREFLQEELRRLGFAVYESDANFFLIRAAEDWRDRLLRKGILVRSCDNFKGLGAGYIRIAVKAHEQNVRLVETVAGIV